MKQSIILFLVVLAASTGLWPWLRELGLAGLPGDLVTIVEGHRLHFPIGTALLISVVISGVWRMLTPR
ncbi:MAG: DUF2905 family protein [Geminicoccaceae bacterium]